MLKMMRIFFTVLNKCRFSNNLLLNLPNSMCSDANKICLEICQADMKTLPRCFVVAKQNSRQTDQLFFHCLFYQEIKINKTCNTNLTQLLLYIVILKVV